jgi:hypothetical protein
MQHSSNHRVAAREHLAEAAALHAEGSIGPAVRRLAAAATAAVTAVVEAAGAVPDRHLLPSAAARALGRRGVAVATVRDVIHDLQLDCLGQDRGRATEFTARMVAEAITAVQALVDLTVAALPVPAAIGPGAGALAVTALPLPEVRLHIPQRPHAWIESGRRQTRLRRARAVLAGVLVAAMIAAAATASFVAGERDGPHSHLDVMARARGLSDLPASSH